jgi:hypothetical protein
VRHKDIPYKLPEEIKGNLKLPCPNCSNFSDAILGETHEITRHYEDGIFSEIELSCMAICQGCKESYLAIFTWDDIDEEEYSSRNHNGKEQGWQFHFNTHPRDSAAPIEYVKLAKTMDKHLGFLINEAGKAISYNLYASAAMTLRAYIDRLTIVMGFTDYQLSPRVEKLKDEGYVPIKLHSLLDKIVDAGHAANHRSWVPSLEDVNAMMRTIGVITNMVKLSKEDPNTLHNIPKK